MSSIFDLRGYDGRLGRRRRVRLFFSPLREVECNQRDLVDGAVLVDVRIRGRAKQAGLHVIKGAWRVSIEHTKKVKCDAATETGHTERHARTSGSFPHERTALQQLARTFSK